jgi:hypothetical protein
LDSNLTRQDITRSDASRTGYSPTCSVHSGVEIHSVLVGRRLRAREVREIEVRVCVSEIEMVVAGRDGDAGIDVVDL